MKVGNYIAVQVVGGVRKYIAEVTKVEPLRAKIEESGPFANIKEGDFVILEEETRRLNDETLAQQMLRDALKKGRPFISGLKSLGFAGNKLHEVWPAEDEAKDA